MLRDSCSSIRENGASKLEALERRIEVTPLPSLEAAGSTSRVESPAAVLVLEEQPFRIDKSLAPFGPTRDGTSAAFCGFQRAAVSRSLRHLFQ